LKFFVTRICCQACNQIRDFKEIRDLLLIELTHARRNTSKTLLTKKYETSPNQIRASNDNQIRVTIKRHKRNTRDRLSNSSPQREKHTRPADFT
jgi:hypothetical protein